MKKKILFVCRKKHNLEFYSRMTTFSIWYFNRTKSNVIIIQFWLRFQLYHGTIWIFDYRFPKWIFPYLCPYYGIRVCSSLRKTRRGSFDCESITIHQSGSSLFIFSECQERWSAVSGCNNTLKSMSDVI